MTIDIWCGNMKVSDHSGNTGVDRRIILKWMRKKNAGRKRSASIWLRVGTCRLRNVRDVSLPPAERNGLLINKESAPLSKSVSHPTKGSSHLSIFT